VRERERHTLGARTRHTFPPRELLCFRFRAQRGQLKRFYRLSPEQWLEPRPESGIDCLICAEFARLRTGKASIIRPLSEASRPIPATNVKPPKCYNATKPPLHLGRVRFGTRINLENRSRAGMLSKGPSPSQPLPGAVQRLHPAAPQVLCNAIFSLKISSSVSVSLSMFLALPPSFSLSLSP